MAHPTRTGDLVVFSFPPYQFDAETPGTLVAAVALLRAARLRARRPGPRREHQHAGDVPGRRRGCREGRGAGAVDRPRADARVPARDPRAAAQPGSRAPRRPQGRQRVQAALVHRAERLPRPARPDGARRSTGSTPPSAAPPSSRRSSTRSSRRLPGPGLILAGGDNVGASPPELGAARGHAGDRRRERVGPRRDVVREPRVRLRRRAAAEHQERANFPFLGDEHRPDGERAGARRGSRRRRCSRSTASRSASSAPRSRTRPSSSRREPRPVSVPRRGAADQGRVRAAPPAGRPGPDRRHPSGHEPGQNTIGNTRRRSVGWPDPRHRRRAPGHDGRRDDRRPHAPHLEPDAAATSSITEGINAGTSYSRAPADGQGRRRHLGRRRDARREEPRRRPAGGREGDRRQGERRHGGRSGTW